MYYYLKEHADKFVYTSKTYFKGCMQVRNRHLVNNSSVCYLTKKIGGTFSTVKYAYSKGLDIYNIYI